MKQTGLWLVYAVLLSALLLSGCAHSGEHSAFGEGAFSGESSSVEASRTERSAESDVSSADLQRHENAPPEEVSLISLLDTVEVLGTEDDMRKFLDDAPPGTLPPVELMPKAAQALVGQTVEICLSPWERQGLNWCAENFLYWRSVRGWERVVLVASTGGRDFLLIGEVSVGGTEAWASAVSSGAVVKLKVLSVTRICWQEVLYTKLSDPAGSGFAEEEWTYEAHALVNEYCMGSLEGGESRMVFKSRGWLSDWMNSMLGVYQNLIQRYSLTDVFPIW